MSPAQMLVVRPGTLPVSGLHLLIKLIPISCVLGRDLPIRNESRNQSRTDLSKTLPKNLEPPLPQTHQQQESQGETKELNDSLEV